MTRHGNYGRPLTVGDGFRVGIGIAFWMIAASVAIWVLLFVVLGGVAVLSRV